LAAKAAEVSSKARRFISIEVTLSSSVQEQDCGLLARASIAGGTLRLSSPDPGVWRMDR
jgi:hypothetical protein